MDLNVPDGSAAPAPPRFQLVPFDEFNPSPPGWLVEDVIPASADVKLISPSGFGKTFAALDLTMHVATGRPWLGTHAVKQGAVVYVCAEGTALFAKRRDAWKQHHGVTDRLPIYILAASPQLNGRDGPDVDAVVTAIKALPEPPVLIVLDTQARLSEGLDENRADDMSRFLGAVARLREETGATTLTIHHPGWSGDRERGSSAQRGAVDTVIVLEPADDWGDEETLRPDHAIRLRCKKMKDAESFEPIELTARKVELPADPDDRPQASLVLVPTTSLAPADALAAFAQSRVPADRKRTPAAVTNAKVAVATYRLSRDDSPPSISAIARESGVSKSTTSASVGRLCESGVLVREGDGYRVAPPVHDVLRRVAPWRGWGFVPDSGSPIALEIRPADWNAGYAAAEATEG